MIDFRYHLVSIVGVFIALAVGIVLGAGPLQQQIGQTLTQQVSQLRSEKADLRSQLDVQQRRLDFADDFATAVTPGLVASRLGGRSVVVVLLPGAESSVADDLTKTVRAAGAAVNGRVKLAPAWADPAPGRSTFRDQLSANLGPLVGSAAPVDGSVDQRMGALLAKALVVPTVAAADRSTPQSEQALSGLREAGLLTTAGDPPKPATLALLVAPDPDGKSASDARKATLATWTATAQALDEASSGVVVVGSTESTEPVGVLGALRTDRSAAAAVSSVDDVALTMGQISVVFALRQQLADQTGQYGTGIGATSVLPPLPTDSP